MKTFSIYGASDDLVETDGVNGCDEFNVNPQGESGYAGTFVLSGGGQTMKIHAFYDGCWHFSPAQLDEGVDLPAWPMRITAHRIRDEIGYSTLIEVDVPDDTHLFRANR